MDLITYALLKKYVDTSLDGAAGALHGDSAYEIAVKHGYEGTEEEWLTSLVGTTPHVGENGNWFIGDEDTGILANVDNIMDDINASVNQAGQAATTAGNYAAQAIQAKLAIEQKIWYGTMAEYNALETVNNSTIYIILHE